MKVTFMGTGGSVPISNPRRSKFGGNTTCVRIESQCLPKGSALVIDAGTGMVPLASQLIKEGVTDLHYFFTHFHHDHTQGLLLAATTFFTAIINTLWGGVEKGIGAHQVFTTLMQPPFFPVNFSHRDVGSHFVFRNFDDPNAEVVVVHPKGGIKRFSASEFEHAESNGKMLKFGSDKFDLSEMMVIRMIKSNHPEFTISYRFEERPTRKVFVFLTDHENTDGIATSLRKHLAGADLLVMDSQYKRAIYDTRTAGYGHGTADYCVRVALSAKAKKLGLVHHDPCSTDEDIFAIVKEAETAFVQAFSDGNKEATLGNQGQSFVVAIADYESFEV